MLKPKPKDSIWTDDQWRAVVETGQNILVSAGAGSGKTAVLTERIIEKIKDGVDVSRLVVLTFTNAAAREMRERVQKALTKAVDQYPHLQEQLTLLDAAQITTFDAYSQFLLKKYHYLLNLDNQIQIINSINKTKLIEETVNELFNQKYQEADPNFIDLINQYTIMTDDNIKREVIYLMDKLNNQITDYNIEEYLNQDKMVNATKEYYQIIRLHINEIMNQLKGLPSLIDGEKFTEHIEKLNQFYEPIIMSDTYYDLTIAIRDLGKKPIMPRTKHEQKEQYQIAVKNIHTIFDKIKGLVIYPDEQAMVSELKIMKHYSQIMLDLAAEANEQLLQKKIALNVFDFIDISKLVIKILTDNPEVQSEVSDNIVEIMIDEYQDTNDIQEHFIDLIANNNVYMVGDIKQAIYGFRNANPQNFQTKYMKYQQNDGGIVIDLNKNFRSREEVLANINTIFQPLMSKEIGGIDYVDKQTLVYGNKMYETKNEVQDQNMEIISYQPDEKITLAEQEARLIAIDIINKVNNNYQVNEKGSLKQIEFKDFAILTAKKKNFDLYKRIFAEYQIPLEVQTTVNDDTKFELYLINAIFRLLYTIEQNDRDVNREHFKFAFYSLLRNYPFDFVDADIAMQVANAHNIYDVLNNPFRQEFADIAEVLIMSYQYYQTNNLAETLIYVIKELRVYQELAKVEDVYAAEMRIIEMINLFASFSDQSLTLADVIEFEQLQSKFQIALEMADPIIVNDNVVKMMTIHKSKGLEFQVVYFPELDARFNKTDVTQKYRMTSNLGYLMPVNECEEKVTIYHEISNYQGAKEIVSEQIRLFYVALTRAKDKMIMLLSEDSLEKNLPIDKLAEVDKVKYSNFKQFLINQSGRLYSYNQILLKEDINYQTRLELTTSSEIICDEINIDYQKINIETTEQIASRASMQKHLLVDGKTKALMELGTTYHNVLETIDFTQSIEEQIINLDVKYQQIVKNVAQLSFVNQAIHAYNEYQFQLVDSNKIITGIIDLLIETETEMVILDYKLEDIFKPEYEEQINTYAKFVKTKSPKPIRGYLYSLINNEIKEVVISE